MLEVAGHEGALVGDGDGRDEDIRQLDGGAVAEQLALDASRQMAASASKGSTSHASMRPRKARTRWGWLTR